MANLEVSLPGMDKYLKSLDDELRLGRLTELMLKNAKMALMRLRRFRVNLGGLAVTCFRDLQIF